MGLRYSLIDRFVIFSQIPIVIEEEGWFVAKFVRDKLNVISER